MLGEYIIVCLVFVVLALLEFALVIILNRKADATKTHEKMNSGLLKEQKWSSSQKHGVSKIAFVEDYSKDTSLGKAGQEWVNSTKRGMENIPSISPIHVIDFTASLLFPLAFAVYNCFYWTRSLDDGKLKG